MWKKKIFIHIGTHKTGTCSIQNFLSVNSKLFSAEGILIPNSGRLGDGHHFIAWELRSDKRLDGKSGFIDALLDELNESNYEKVIISSEDFEYLSQYPERLRYFLSLLAKIEIEPIFIVFFRENMKYLKSLYFEMHFNQGLNKEFNWYRNQLRRYQTILVNKDWFFDFNRERFVSRWENITASKLLQFDYDFCVQSVGVLPSFLTTVGSSSDLIEKSRSWPHLNCSKYDG